METTAFNNLLFKTAFCCMTCDGEIDKNELKILARSPIFKDIDVETEANDLIRQLNSQGAGFLKAYFDVLDKSVFTEDEELRLIDMAIKMIMADNIIQYAEIKFFKNIRYRLRVSNDTIIQKFGDEVPDIELFIEQDIMTGSFLDKITNQYLDLVEIPQFDALSFDTSIFMTH